MNDALAACGVELGEHDYTEPSLHTAISDGLSIQVHRVEYRDTVVEESIPYETEYVYTSLFYRNRNRTQLVQQGHEGTNQITHCERVVDGVVESSQVISVVQTVAPRTPSSRSIRQGRRFRRWKGLRWWTACPPATRRCTPAGPPATVPAGAEALPGWVCIAAPLP